MVTARLVASAVETLARQATAEATWTEVSVSVCQCLTVELRGQGEDPNIHSPSV